MSYPPWSSRSSHEADGRSDRSGGSGGTGSGSGGGGGKGPQKSRFAPVPLIQSNPTTATWKKWATSFDSLFNDGEGVSLFKAYLDSENCGNLLDFWFACQGFRNKIDPTDKKKISQLIKVIYQTYIRGSACATSSLSSAGSSQAIILPSSRHQSSQRYQPVRLQPQTRKAIAERILHKVSLDQTVFDEAQNEIGYFLRNTAYLAFLESDFFISYMQQNFVHSSPSVPLHLIDPSPDANFQNNIFGPPSNQPYGALPTVEEDQELNSQKFPANSSSKLVSLYQLQPQSTVDYHNRQSYPFSLNSQSLPCTQSNLICTCSLGNQPPGSQPTLQQTQLNYPCVVQKKSPRGSCVVSWYSPIPQPTTAVPLTQENIQITRFQRAEIPVPQHLSFCPNCHTPLPYSNDYRESQLIPNSDNLQHQSQLCFNSKKFAGTSARPLTPLTSLPTWVDAVCPKHQYYNYEAFQKAPPNPYHVSYAPVSAQDSERHSMSSGAYTDENLSLNDTKCDEVKTNLHKVHAMRRGGHIYKCNKFSCSLPTKCSGESLVHNQQKNLLDLLSTNQTSMNEQQSESSVVATVTQTFPSKTADDGQCRHQRQILKSTTDSGGLHSVPSLSMEGREIDGSSQKVKHISAAPSGTIAVNLKETNVAQVDPTAFAKLLSDRLQKIVDNQAAIEKISSLFSENAPDEEYANIDIPTNSSTSQPSMDKPNQKQDNLDVNKCYLVGNVTTSSAIESGISGPNIPNPADAKPSRVENSAEQLSDKQLLASASSVLQRPWADRLLAAARVQHQTEVNAQSILEDHCSRIWATSADRTPTSSGSRGSRQLESGDGPSNNSKAEDNEEQEELFDNLLPIMGEPTLQSRKISSNLTTANLFAPASFGYENQFSMPASSSMNKTSHNFNQAILDPQFCDEASSDDFHELAHKVIPCETTIGNQSPPVEAPASPSSLVVGYYLCDDPVPYRSHWPSREINLGQFKRLLPKKGPFRFFFKKASDEFGSGVVHQEILNDESILPLWEGKVVAKVERID